MTRHKAPSNKTLESSSQIWGGRFSGQVSDVMKQINASIHIDHRLYRQDIEGSLAHVEMLVAQKIISAQDGKAIVQGLKKVRGEIDKGDFTFSMELEDIHMNVEGRLKELIGDPAGRLHTARSRNDQVATDFKLWVRDRIDDTVQRIGDLQAAFLTQAETHIDTITPGFTHLQSAQPVTFGHHCLAYVEMLERDKGRFTDARARLNECPLGAAALAGTSFPIDRSVTAERLGFDQPTANSLDSVSDRDFAMEALSAAAITSVHLSRLAEEIVLWMSSPFGFATLSDEFTTGSSIMPQKRNPDAAELVRAKTGRIFGAQTALQTLMKGLPLAYSKDMQEDKENTFLAFDALELSLKAMTGMVGDLNINVEAMRRAAASGFSTATDLADWCVRELDIPFRRAHAIAGQAVALAEKKGKDLAELSLDDLQSVEPALTQAVFDVLSVENSVRSRTSHGGTAPKNVKDQVAKWKAKLQL